MISVLLRLESSRPLGTSFLAITVWQTWVSSCSEVLSVA